MCTRPRLTPRFLHLLCLGWLLVICVSSALEGLPGDGGAPARPDSSDGPAARVRTSARVDDRPHRAIPPPYRRDGHLASCGRIDAFYSRPAADLPLR